MSQVVAALDSGHPLPPNACAITVDDGFRDFFEVAQPILSMYRIPATVFVVTDFLDGSLWLWGDRVKYAFLHTPLQGIGFAMSGREFQFDLSSPSRRSKAAFDVKEHCKQISQEERLAWIAGLQRLLQVSIPEDPPQEFRPLQWADVRALAKQGVEFGAHTRTHPILSTIRSETELRDEIAGSKRVLEEKLDRPAVHFCYPNGRLSDIGPATLDIVRSSGFRSAVTTESGLNYANADRFLLRRIGADCELPVPYFRQCVAAFRV